MDVDFKLIGKRIKEARLEWGITQADLADRVGIATSYMSRIENGLARFSVDILIRIAEVLQVSTDELLRPNVPATDRIYGSELDEILSGCTSQERETLLSIFLTIKKFLRDKQ